jgi:hypothetical protein
MVKKSFCDNCNKELDFSDNRFKSAYKSNQTSFELCLDCINKIERIMSKNADDFIINLKDDMMLELPNLKVDDTLCIQTIKFELDRRRGTQNEKEN